MAKISLFMDEDVHLALSSALRKRGFDAEHAQELDRKGLSDAEQLSHSAARGKCLFSFNMKDFVELHNEWVQNDQEHWGIIVSKQRPIGETLRRILKLLQRYSRESMKNRIEFL